MAWQARCNADNEELHAVSNVMDGPVRLNVYAMRPDIEEGTFASEPSPSNTSCYKTISNPSFYVVQAKKRTDDVLGVVTPRHVASHSPPTIINSGVEQSFEGELNEPTV